MRFNQVLTFFITLIVINAYSQNHYQISEGDLKLIKESFVSEDDSIKQFESLYNLTKDKSFVSIGEATHGTDEIRKIQIQISKNLTQKHNFQVIALGESPLLDSYPLFDYVVNGNGNPKALSNLFHFNIADLLLSLKQSNLGKPWSKKVWLLGCGVDTPEKIIDFVSTHCTNYHLSAASKLIFNISKTFSNRPNSPTSRDSLAFYTSELVNILNNHKGKADSLDFKVDCMIKAVSNLPKLFANRTNSLVAFLERDSVIYQNLEWLFTSKGKTVIVFAHNFHTNKKAILKDVYTQTYKPFGEYLANKYGTKYLSIATEIQKGFFYNGSPEKQPILEHPMKLGTILGENIPSNLGFITIHEGVRNIFNNSSLKITKGTLESALTDGQGVIGDAFDAMIFIKSSSPYLFYEDDDFCVLYLDLDKELKQILTAQKITLLSLFETNQEGTTQYSIYFNDVNKKLLSHNTRIFSVKDSNATFEIPQNTEYISVSLVLRKVTNFKLNSIQVNERPIALDKLAFFDWNHRGYSFKQNRKYISVTR
ncbi:erythromycin esterase family protein [Flectobacillus roseus]